MSFGHKFVREFHLSCNI